MKLNFQQLVLIGVGFGLAVVLFYVVQVAKRMRRLLGIKVKRIVFSVALYFGTAETCHNNGLDMGRTLLISIGVGLLPLLLIRSPKQSRSIPKAIKRAVIARDQPSGGYSSRRYHFDHTVPFKRGGDTSFENLRLIPNSRISRKAHAGRD